MNHNRFVPLSLVIGLSFWQRPMRVAGVVLALAALIGVLALVLMPDDSLSVTNSALVAKPVEAAVASPAPPTAAQTVAAAVDASRTETAQAGIPTTAALPTPTPTLLPQPTITVPVIPTATPVPAPTASPFNSFVPVRFKIPTIGVDTIVEGVGKTPNGAMDVPKNVWNVAWYNLGPHPGEHGSAVIAGHLDSVNGVAVFWHLNDLQPGAKIYVTDAKNRQLEFEVVSKTIFAYNDPTAIGKIFDFNSPSMLNLITCNGTYDRSAQNYNNRLVVFSKFIGPVTK